MSKQVPYKWRQKNSPLGGSVRIGSRRDHQSGADSGRSQGGDECRWRQMEVPITGGRIEYQGGSDGGRNQGGGDGRMKQVEAQSTGGQRPMAESIVGGTRVELMARPPGMELRDLETRVKLRQ